MGPSGQMQPRGSPRFPPRPLKKLLLWRALWPRSASTTRTTKFSPRVTTLNIEGVDLIQNARSYVATVMLELTGAPFGSVLEGRWIHVHTDGTTWQSGVIERTSTGTLGSGTSSNLDFPYAGSVERRTEKVRFEVTYYQVDLGTRVPLRS